MTDTPEDPPQRIVLQGWLRWCGPLVAVLVALVVAFDSVAAEEPSCPVDTHLQADIDKLATDAMRESATPGLALGIVREGRILYLKGYGVGRKDAPTPAKVTCRTTFHVASLSKPVIATMVLQAVERGELKEAQTIADVLGSGSPSVTVGALLTHTGGMRDWSHAKARRTEGERSAYFRAILKKTKRVGRTGEFRYSDTDYNILGLMLETISGRPLDALARERVFTPLGMSDSAFARPLGDFDFAWPHLGTSNRPAQEHPFDIAFAPSSGLQASVRDLALFAKACLDRDERLLSAAGFRNAIEPRTSTSWAGIFQSPVWQVVKADGRTVLQHGGTDTGFRALLSLYPDTRSAIVILANGEELDRWKLRQDIERVLMHD
ncbi:serine hydrolase domain-containing protein [Erythrobacter mangrovi]|uniref:Beta-lactamase family protein n=1 Tax=Erythrobacter mangrovi TaxID=2739433 RepID=A0A7D3XU88_9SPHN|nr:serine hydrolase domain-containing protein [Erythrobacter mangrovi]QKG70636.1 beta-lactamase family protein [Erythrobacter mangrovi]